MTVVLHTTPHPGVEPKTIDMPGATTGRYAAKRAAEAWGLDPDVSEYGLVDVANFRLIPMDEPVADFDTKLLMLVTGQES